VEVPQSFKLAGIRRVEPSEVLSVHWVQRATALWNFRFNSNLSSLRLFDITKLNDLSAFEAGANLEELEIGTKITSKDLVVPSLQPLAGLSQIKRLVIGFQKIQDAAIEPLALLSTLEHIVFGTALFSTEQNAWLRAHLPGLGAQSTCNAFVQTQRVPYRGKEVDTMIVGHRKPWLSSTLDADRISAYQTSFDEMVRFFTEHPAAGPASFKQRAT